MARPGLLGRIEIKPGAFAQVVSGIVGHIVATRAGVRHHQRNAQLGGNTLRAGFGGEVFVVTGQAGKPEQNRRVFRRRQENAERHCTVQRGGVVPPALLSTFKTTVLFEQFHAGLLNENAYS